MTTIPPLHQQLPPLEERFWSELESALDGRQLTLGRKMVGLRMGMFESYYGYRIEIWRVGQINPWYHWKESYPGISTAPSAADKPSSGPDLPEKFRRFWKEPETDDARIQGTWNYVANIYDGEATDPEEFKLWKEVFAKGEWTSQTSNGSFKGTYQLDRTKTPTTINIVCTEGPDKGLIYAGIYELDGDNLKFCFAPWGSLEHPNEFSSTPASRRADWKSNAISSVP